MTDIIDIIVKRNLTPSKNYIYGFANLTGLLSNKFEGFDYGISIGRILDNDIVDKIIDGPTMEYYLHYKCVNKELSDLADKITNDLKNRAIESLKIEPTVPSVELDTIYAATLRTDISHKMVATRAGLGWIGKTDLFISRDYGPRLRLTSILLKVPLKQKLKPIVKSFCGTCNKCVEICPAHAATGKLWNVNVKREEFFDPWKCRAQCTEFGRIKLGSDARVCGICVAVCPFGLKKNKQA